MNAQNLDDAVERHYQNLFTKPIDLTKEKYSGWDRLDVTEISERECRFRILFKLKKGKIFTGYYGSRKYLLY